MIACGQAVRVSFNTSDVLKCQASFSFNAIPLYTPQQSNPVALDLETIALTSWSCTCGMCQLTVIKCHLDACLLL